MRAVCSAAIAARTDRRVEWLEMTDALRRLSVGAGTMLELHVLAAMRTVDVLPFHRPRAERASIAVTCEQVQADRRQRNHYQSDQRLLHEITIRSGQAVLKSVLERADIHMMALRHQVQKRVEVRVGQGCKVLFDLADDPALAAV
jgi:hypothetical protein